MASRMDLSAAIVLSSMVGVMGSVFPAAAVPGEAMAELSSPSTVDTTDTTIAQTPAYQGYDILHVNAIAGHDLQGDGSQLRPLKTITRALQIAQPNTLILLARGEYSAATGETFPLQLRSGVTVQGAAGPNTAEVLIRGNGSYLSPLQGLQNVAILGADNAGLGNVMVSNPHPGGTGLWIEAGSPVVLESAFIRNGSAGIVVAGTGALIIRGNYFAENGEAGLIIAGASAAVVQGNVFENTGTGITVAPEATPQILENRIAYNHDGLVLHADARPILRDNQITNNRRNSILDYSAWEGPTPTAPQATQPAPPAPAIAMPTVTPITPTAERVPMGGDIPAPTVAAASPSDHPAAIAEAAELTPEVTEQSEPEAEVAAEPPAEAAEAIAESPPTPVVTAEAAPVATARRAATPSTPLNALVTPLADGLRETLPALEAVDIAVIPAIPATAALATLDLSPTLTVPEALAAATTNEPPPVDAAPPVAEAAVPIPTVPAAPSAAPEEATAVAASELSLAERIRARRDRLQARAEADRNTPEAVEIPIIPPPVETVAAPEALPPAPAIAPAESATPAPPLTDLETLPELPPLVPNSSADNAARIIVPSPDIPSGPVGNLPELFTMGAGSAVPSSAGPPPPPSLAAGLGLAYRVLVEAEDTAIQAQVRQQVPDAFRVSVDGRMFMQAGAYATYEEAHARAQQLNQQGLSSRIEPIR